MSTEAPADGDVMASLDDAGPERRLVIANVDREEAWVSVVEDAAATLPDWR
jgi:hypothetical protein